MKQCTVMNPLFDYSGSLFCTGHGEAGGIDPRRGKKRSKNGQYVTLAIVVLHAILCAHGSWWIIYKFVYEHIYIVYIKGIGYLAYIHSYSNINDKFEHTKMLGIYCCFKPQFYLHGLTLIWVWVCNYVPRNVWDEITNPFLNFTLCTVDK